MDEIERNWSKADSYSVHHMSYLFLNMTYDGKFPCYSVRDPSYIKNYHGFFMKYNEWEKSISSKKNMMYQNLCSSYSIHENKSQM